MKGRLRLLIIVGGVVVVVLVAGVLGFNILGPMFLGSPAATAEAAAVPEATAAEAAPKEAEVAKTKAAAKTKADAEPVEKEHGELGPIVIVPERLVNLSGEGPYAVLQVIMTLEFAPKEEISAAVGEEKKTLLEEFNMEMLPYVALIEDGVNSIIATKSGAELATPEGKAKLKEEILAMANQYTPTPVVAVYFNRFFMQ